MGSNFSSSYQHVEVSQNKKWLYLPDCNAYINVNSIVFFVIEKERITFKLVDNDNDKSHDGWYTPNGRAVSKFQTVELTKEEIENIVDVLTK